MLRLHKTAVVYWSSYFILFTYDIVAFCRCDNQQDQWHLAGLGLTADAHWDAECCH